MRIVAEEQFGRWYSRLIDPPLPEVYSGSTALKALERLLGHTPYLDVRLEDFEPDRAVCSISRLEMVQVVRRVCPECGGSGKYVGLNEVERCAACEGMGRR